MGNCNGLFSKCTDEDGLKRLDQHTIKAAVEQNNRMKARTGASSSFMTYTGTKNGYGGDRRQSL